MAYTVIQQGNDRYTFEPQDGRLQRVVHEHRVSTGAYVSMEYVTAEKGNALYISMMEKGFKRFKNPSDASWYATIEDGSYIPQGERNWTVDGKYLVRE